MLPVFGYEYTTRTHLIVSDEDAADFLQSQFTNDLRPFQEGQCTYGLWLDVKGKVLADSFVLCEGEEQFRLLSVSSEASVLAEQLKRHIIADDVEIVEAADAVGFALVGDGAEAILTALGLSVPGEGRFESAGGMVVFSGRRACAPNVELICLHGDAVTRVRETLDRFEVTMVSMARIELERLQAGFPLVPIELGPGDLAGEGGLEQDAVSFKKGCYLGQEVVARMHHIGRPQRTLYLVAGASGRPPCPLPLYNHENKQVGELRTAVESEQGWQGVALLKNRFVAVGGTLVSDLGGVVVERVFRETKGTPS